MVSVPRAICRDSVNGYGEVYGIIYNEVRKKTRTTWRVREISPKRTIGCMLSPPSAMAALRQTVAKIQTSTLVWLGSRHRVTRVGRVGTCRP